MHHGYKFRVDLKKTDLAIAMTMEFLFLILCHRKVCDGHPSSNLTQSSIICIYGKTLVFLGIKLVRLLRRQMESSSER